MDGTTALRDNGLTENNGPVRLRNGDGPNRARLKKERVSGLLLLHQPQSSASSLGLNSGPNRPTAQTGPNRAVLRASHRELHKTKGGRAELTRSLPKARPEPNQLTQLTHQTHQTHGSRLRLQTGPSAPQKNKLNQLQNHRLRTKPTLIHSPRTAAPGSKRTPPRPGPALNLDLDRTEPVPESTYAGAKFSEPPSARDLPRPPTHWVRTNSSKDDMSLRLKALLRVQDQD